MVPELQAVLLGIIVRPVEVVPAPIVFPTFDEPRASIVIAANGASTLLERCLERLAATVTHAIAFETIVVLNSAEEGRAEELQARVPGARIEASRVNLGLAGALNRGRTKARGEFLVLLHDDAEVEPGWLEALVAAAERDPRAGAVGSLVLDLDGGVQAAGAELLPDGRTRLPWAPGKPPHAVAAGAGHRVLRRLLWLLLAACPRGQLGPGRGCRRAVVSCLLR